MIFAVLSCIYGPLLIYSDEYNICIRFELPFEYISEWLEKVSANEQSKASYKARIEQNVDGRRGVGGRILSELDHFCNTIRNWYPGSTLSTIITAFRDVSLYTAAILLLAYMIIDI